MSPRVVVLSAPSGGGKTTIARTLLEKRRDVGYSVSATTRQPRAGERPGAAYHFLTRAEFERRAQAGEFLEWAEYAGELYGTLRGEVERELQRGRHVVLAIDVAGARAVRNAYPPPKSVSVFLLPPSAAALLERLGQRRSDDRRGVARRLAHAVDELREVRHYDHVVVNDELDRAVAEVERIIDNPPPRRAPDGTVAARLESLGQELADVAARLQRAP